MGPIQVVEYDPSWPDEFGRLRDRIRKALGEIAVAIEHVGSTSVPGLAAKPVIDMDVVIPSRDELPAAADQLTGLGYRHVGNLGIEDREAFSAPAGAPAHNLYVCPRQSVALRNHLVLRDHLRARPLDAEAYAALKRQLASKFPHDVGSYVEGKSSFILSILAQHGFSADRLDAIRRGNRRL